MAKKVRKDLSDLVALTQTDPSNKCARVWMTHIRPRRGNNSPTLGRPQAPRVATMRKALLWLFGWLLMRRSESSEHSFSMGYFAEHPSQKV
jgi:hypothetical protein